MPGRPIPWYANPVCLMRRRVREVLGDAALARALAADGLETIRPPRLDHRAAELLAVCREPWPSPSPRASDPAPEVPAAG